MEKYRASSLDGDNWTCQVYSDYYGRYVDIPLSPVFSTPTAAIRWGSSHWEAV